MGFKKLPEETVVQSLNSNSHILVTHDETVQNVTKHVVRRIPLNYFDSSTGDSYTDANSDGNIVIERRVQS